MRYTATVYFHNGERMSRFLDGYDKVGAANLAEQIARWVFPEREIKCIHIDERPTISERSSSQCEGYQPATPQEIKLGKQIEAEIGVEANWAQAVKVANAVLMRTDNDGHYDPYHPVPYKFEDLDIFEVVCPDLSARQVNTIAFAETVLERAIQRKNDAETIQDNAPAPSP